jgi:hypothetical protein
LPIINVADADQFEPKAAPEGSYPLRIVKAEAKPSKAGNPMVVVTLKIEGNAGADAPLVTEYLTVPKEGDQWYRMQMQNLHRFCGLFGITSFDPESPTDVANLEGLTAECYLKVDEFEGKESNKLRLPKVGKR